MRARYLSFLLATALILLHIQNLRAIEPPPYSERFLTLRHEISAESEQAAVREASILSLKSAVGRLCFSDYLLRARQILDPYIEQHWDRLIAQYRLRVSEVRGGRRFVDIEVVVDNEKLVADLDEKRFLYRPALRPVFYIFLSETFDGRPAAATGRQRLLETIFNREYRYLWEPPADDPNIPFAQRREVVMPDFSPAQDVSRTPQLLAEACREAQRNEVEVFLTGSIETTTTRSNKVYFDDYTFVKSRCALKLVRADTGEILASGETETAAGHVEALKAADAAVLAAVNLVAPALFDTFDKQWARTVLRKANVRLLVLGINPESLALVREILQGVSPQIEIRTRSQYADTAVLTLSWEGKTEDLVELLRRTQYPSFSLSVIGPGEMILSVL